MALTNENSFLCPYCSTDNSLSIDFSAGSNQRLLTDCEICCSPIIVEVQIDSEQDIYLNAYKENE
jgi:transcription elongation factor Elf1